MKLTEKVSKHLGVPYVYLPEENKYLCQNGVMFTLEEYKKGINLNEEYEKREKEGTLYDYNYAKSTGLLRKKRNTTSKNIHEESIEKITEKVDSEETQKEAIRIVDEVQGQRTNICERRNNKQTDYPEGLRHNEVNRRNTNSNKSVIVICALLAFTSVISMYVSTLHTATYLLDYADLISAWLMSASVTAYNSTAFEVSLLFRRTKRYVLTTIFMFLWAVVTLFSMATTVSVFYDSFNFEETQIAEENKSMDSARLKLELLQKKESDLRQAIEDKKQDIAHRQSLEYGTRTQQVELADLQKGLQSNLDEQQELMEVTPEATKTEEETKKKETFFAFLGRVFHLEGGILEFIMSTLAAIFVNLIAPLSLSAVIELLYKDNLTK